MQRAKEHFPEARPVTTQRRLSVLPATTFSMIALGCTSSLVSCSSIAPALNGDRHRDEPQLALLAGGDRQAAPD